MGAPTDMLVVVAIMYDNPQGLKKEEIVNKLEKIHIPRNYSDIFFEQNRGLYGLAYLFNLNNTQEYLASKKKYLNEKYEYFSKREHLHPHRKQEIGVTFTNHKVLGETTIDYHDFDSSEFFQHKGYTPGDYVWTSAFGTLIVPEKYNNSKNRFLIKDVVSSQIKEEENLREINQKFNVEVVRINSRTFRFNSFEELWKKYPEYQPERMYDFEQEQGKLYPYNDLLQRDIVPFKWLKKGEKYFLDFEHFEKILNANSYFGNEALWKHKNQKSKSHFSLTDVVLTSEVIRRRNWKLLRYNALFNFNPNFIYKNERTLRRYEEAVFETEQSVKAQKQELTISEFLREHHYSKLKRKTVPFQEIQRMLKEENKKIGTLKRKRTIEQKKEDQNKEPELPF